MYYLKKKLKNTPFALKSFKTFSEGGPSDPLLILGDSIPPDPPGKTLHPKFHPGYATAVNTCAATTPRAALCMWANHSRFDPTISYQLLRHLRRHLVTFVGT